MIYEGFRKSLGEVSPFYTIFSSSFRLFLKRENNKKLKEVLSEFDAVQLKKIKKKN
jgi:hypothetical protein